MCTVLLPPGVNPIAVKYTCISYHIIHHIQHTKCMRRVYLWAARLHRVFPRYLINGTIFGKKRHWTKYVLIVCTILSAIFLILRRIKLNIAINVYRSSCNVPSMLVTFQWNLNFLYRFSENHQIPNFMKIHPVGAEVLRACGQTCS
jgi:hypothetical protein